MRHPPSWVFISTGLLLIVAITSPAGAAVIKVPLLKLTAAQIKGLHIELAQVTPAEVQPVARVPAMFTPPPNGRVAVSAPYPGVVTRVSVVEGQSVRPGQSLANVFSRDALTAAADLAQARAETEVAADAERRTAELVREGIVAGAREEETHARLKSAEAIEHAKALGVNAAGIDSAGHYALKSPIAGRVANVGVQAGQALAAGAPAFTVDVADRIQAQATLAADLAGRVRVGDRAVVEGAQGRVVSVGAQVDPTTRSVSLLAEVPPRPAFIPGRMTTVQIFDAGTRGLWQAPRGALVRVHETPVVFVKRAGGFAPVPVDVSGFADGAVTFRGAVSAGTPVAVSGVSELKDLAEK